jgi:hypothetical protein
MGRGLGVKLTKNYLIYLIKTYDCTIFVCERCIFQMMKNQFHLVKLVKLVELLGSLSLSQAPTLTLVEARSPYFFLYLSVLIDLLTLLVNDLVICHN